MTENRPVLTFEGLTFEPIKANDGRRGYFLRKPLATVFIEGYGDQVDLTGFRKIFCATERYSHLADPVEQDRIALMRVARLVSRLPEHFMTLLGTHHLNVGGITFSLSGRVAEDRDRFELQAEPGIHSGDRPELFVKAGVLRHAFAVDLDEGDALEQLQAGLLGARTATIDALRALTDCLASIPDDRMRLV